MSTPPLLNATNILVALRAETALDDHRVVWDMTGGWVGTIFIDPDSVPYDPDNDGEGMMMARAIIGPFSYLTPDEENDEIYVGHDDWGDTTPVTCTTVDAVVAAVLHTMGILPV